MSRGKMSLYRHLVQEELKRVSYSTSRNEGQHNQPSDPDAEEGVGFLPSGEICRGSLVVLLVAQSVHILRHSLAIWSKLCASPG